MVTVKRRRLINPSRTAAKKKNSGSPKRAKRRAHHKKANPGSLITLGVLNPKGSIVKKQRKSNGARRKKNPIVAKKRNGFRPRRRRNPLGVTAPLDMVKTGALALAGLVATRQIPQLLLQEKNSNWLGYVANGATAAATAALTTKMAGKGAGQAVLIGGMLYTVNRIITEKLSPVGKVLQLAGLGDPQASSSTMGRLLPGSVYPPAYDRAGNLKVPPQFVQAIAGQLPAPAVAAAPSRVSGVGRMRSRVAA